MKRIFDFMIAAAIFLAAAGCAKEIEEEIQAPEQQEDEAGTMVIGAELSDSPDADDVTKTLISDNGNKTYSVFWADGDQILVNGETSTNIDIDPDNKKSASFTLDVVKAPYCAVYPAGLYVKDSYKTVKEDSTVIEITIPSTQKYVEKGFDQDAAIMTARGEAGGGLAFKHAMAYLKVAVTGTTVKSIRVNGNDNEALSGAYTISYSKSGIAFGPKKNEEGKAIGNTSATISCGESGVASGTPVFIAIPAREYKSGLTLTIVNAENQYQVVHSMKTFTAVPGKVYPTTITFNAAGTYLEGGIYTVEDWNGFVAAVNKGDWSAWKTTVDGKEGVHLMADIYSSTNLPRTNDKKADGSKCEWNGEFYGHNNTITHAGTEPLFLHVGENGKIMDLKVAGERIANTNNGWPGVLVLNNSGEINNCESSVNITLEENSTNASTICRSNNGKIINCKNSGNITIKNPTAEVKVGGITLYSSGTITGCTNTGAINVTGVNVNCLVSGVVLMASGKVSDLANEGDMTVEANLTATREIYMGGVIGKCETPEINIIHAGNVVGEIFRCKNSGNLIIRKSGAFHMKGGCLGGVAASVNTGSSTTDCTIFDSCINSGSISFYEKETILKSGIPSGAYAVGGILGRCSVLKDVYYDFSSKSYTVIRVNCVNTGNIDVCTANGQPMKDGNSGARQTYVGGIAGFVGGGVVRGNKGSASAYTIKLGSLFGGICAGGILGGSYATRVDDVASYVNVNFAKSANTYVTPTKIGYVGAVLGWAASSISIKDVKAEASFNFPAELTTENYKCGFAGVKSSATLTVTSCTYNKAAVAASDIYGGGTKTIN
ncbi:MAG: hypothetical protein LKJ87_05495 [Bacteroidales bacterium]|nr:hypothetical protein [Bacteroidales bacterium]